MCIIFRSWKTKFFYSVLFSTLIVCVVCAEKSSGHSLGRGAEGIGAAGDERRGQSESGLSTQLPHSQHVQWGPGGRLHQGVRCQTLAGPRSGVIFCLFINETKHKFYGGIMSLCSLISSSPPDCRSSLALYWCSLSTRCSLSFLSLSDKRLFPLHCTDLTAIFGLLLIRLYYCSCYLCLPSSVSLHVPNQSSTLYRDKQIESLEYNVNIGVQSSHLPRLTTFPSTISFFKGLFAAVTSILTAMKSKLFRPRRIHMTALLSADSTVTEETMLTVMVQQALRTIISGGNHTSISFA